MYGDKTSSFGRPKLLSRGISTLKIKLQQEITKSLEDIK
jgi:hypothetical protein